MFVFFSSHGYHLYPHVLTHSFPTRRSSDLEVGADDYVTKPYRLLELVARMRAVLRRRSADAGAGALGSEALEVGDVALDPERHEVVIRGDRKSTRLNSSH